jgi:hypothetical protein
MCPVAHPTHHTAMYAPDLLEDLKHLGTHQAGCTVSEKLAFGLPPMPEGDDDDDNDDKALKCSSMGKEHMRAQVDKHKQEEAKHQMPNAQCVEDASILAIKQEHRLAPKGSEPFDVIKEDDEDDFICATKTMGLNILFLFALIATMELTCFVPSFCIIRLLLRKNSTLNQRTSASPESAGSRTHQCMKMHQLPSVPFVIIIC